jgi:hypothetical protein
MRSKRVADLINVGGTRPKALPGKMCLLLSARLHNILLDIDLNGVAVVARNMHVAVAFAAMQFHRFARALASKRLVIKPKVGSRRQPADKFVVRVNFSPGGSSIRVLCTP